MSTKLLCKGFTGYGTMNVTGIERYISATSYTISVNRNWITTSGVYHSLQRDAETLYRYGNPVIQDALTCETSVQIECTVDLLNDFIDLICNNRKGRVWLKFIDPSTGFVFDKKQNYVMALGFSVSENSVLVMKIDFFTVMENVGSVSSVFSNNNYHLIGMQNHFPFKKREGDILAYYRFGLQLFNGIKSDVIEFDFNFSQNLNAKYAMSGVNDDYAPACYQIVFERPTVEFGCSVIMNKAMSFDFKQDLNNGYLTREDLKTQNVLLKFDGKNFLNLKGCLLQEVNPVIGNRDNISLYEMKYLLLGNMENTLIEQESSSIVKKKYEVQINNTNRLLEEVKVNYGNFVDKSDSSLYFSYQKLRDLNTNNLSVIVEQTTDSREVVLNFFGVVYDNIYSLEDLLKSQNGRSFYKDEIVLDFSVLDIDTSGVINENTYLINRYESDSSFSIILANVKEDYGRLKQYSVSDVQKKIDEIDALIFSQDVYEKYLEVDIKENLFDFEKRNYYCNAVVELNEKFKKLCDRYSYDSVAQIQLMNNKIYELNENGQFRLIFEDDTYYSDSNLMLQHGVYSNSNLIYDENFVRIQVVSNSEIYKNYGDVLYLYDKSFSHSFSYSNSYSFQVIVLKDVMRDLLGRLSNSRINLMSLKGLSDKIDICLQDLSDCFDKSESDLDKIFDILQKIESTNEEFLNISNSHIREIINEINGNLKSLFYQKSSYLFDFLNESFEFIKYNKNCLNEKIMNMIDGNYHYLLNELKKICYYPDQSESFSGSYSQSSARLYLMMNEIEKIFGESDSAFLALNSYKFDDYCLYLIGSNSEFENIIKTSDDIQDLARWIVLFKNYLMTFDSIINYVNKIEKNMNYEIEL